jgi:ubiquitin-like protein Nedd8
MQILIKTLTGKRLPMNFEPDNTVLQVKQSLQEKEGINIDQIRLISGGKQMADESRLADYNLKAGEIIHMVLQLRGGY